MLTIRVIPRRRIPARAPTQLTAVTYLMLDHFKAQQILWTVSEIILTLFWLAFIVCCFAERPTDVYQGRD